eukprot:TRINITY_DN2013_c0_g1_i2.p1 TRINITY_DN2013_c0_g1~~TRINITY_DN2013_c0_g1_i2.p1  ORF type:complete len:237 (+),score=21.60 TRINITY_DN2013_c0_g1_i2:352-1062(+)
MSLSRHLFQKALCHVPELLSCSLLQHIRYQKTQSTDADKWQFLSERGLNLNPCNSPLHPAVIQGVISLKEGKEVSVQEAYDPQGICFGCGIGHKNGLGLRSKRIGNGLEARFRIGQQFQAFPGIINGGIISTLMDCHGNWTAAVALMDRAVLAKPPLTLTSQILVDYKEITPPDELLLLRSQVANIVDGEKGGVPKTTVEVRLGLYLAYPVSDQKLLVSGTGLFKKFGGSRSPGIE